MHHVEIAYVSYFNDEFLAVNSLELVYRYTKGFYCIWHDVHTAHPCRFSLEIQEEHI